MFRLVAGLSHTELGALKSYITALGGNLRIVAEFGEMSPACVY
jgi:hypothetical protein